MLFMLFVNLAFCFRLLKMTVLLFFDKVTASSGLNAFEFSAVLYSYHPPLCVLSSASRVLKQQIPYGNIKKLLVRT